MPVQMYRNHQPGPTVLASDIKGTESVEWQGAGDPNGGDIQPVSEIIQGSPAFTRAVRRGILSLVDMDSQEYLDADQAQQTHWESRMGASAAQAAAVIDQEANNDLIAIPCVGPSSRPGELRCGVEVTVKDARRNEEPPLCNQHQGLKHEYVPEDVVVDGKAVKSWTRVSIGARERYQP